MRMANYQQILKNFQLLTKLRLSDPTLSKLAQKPNATFRDLVEEIMEAQKPKPQGTHENLVLNSDLVTQGNVKLAERKITSIDREEALGRWKVITTELRKRDLPIPRNKHRSRGDKRRQLTV
jgi:hypothetical protein